MKTVLAQSLEIGTKNPIRLNGPLVGINKLADVFNIILSFLFPFIGLFLLFEFLLAGYDLIRSEGTPEKVKAAKNRITYAIFGLFLFILAFLVARLVAFILGFGGELF